MGNSINKVFGNNNAIDSVKNKSAEDYSKQVASIQENINDIYNQILINDYDRDAMEDELNEASEGKMKFIDDYQESSNEMFNDFVDMAPAMAKGYMSMISTVVNTAMANPDMTPEDKMVIQSMMTAATTMVDAVMPFIIKAAEKAQTKKNEMIDKFQQSILDKNKQTAEDHEKGIKDKLKKETIDNGGKVVEGSGVQINMTGSENEDLYIEGSGNTIVIDGDYAGNIVFAPDSTDNKIIIKGSHNEAGSISMGGENNQIKVEGDVNSKVIIGGDGNQLNVDGDVNSDINFGGEANKVNYKGEFAGEIPVNSSPTNSVNKIQEIDNKNSKLKGEIDDLEGDLDEAEKNEKESENQGKNPGIKPPVDKNGIPLPGSPIGRA